MENVDGNNEEARTSSQVSSSQCSWSAKNSPENNAFSDSTGARLTLKGKIWMEMENALVLDIDWKGIKYTGTLIKVDESDIWGPQRLKKYPQLPAKDKKHKIWKKFKTLESGLKRKQGLYSMKYPRSFVHSSNIVESKLRFGRDKRFVSYGSCPNSPRISNFRKDVCRNSVGDLSSLAINDSHFKRRISLNFTKTFGEPQLSPSEPSGLQNVKFFTERETQCNEVNSTITSDNSVDGTDAQYNNPKVETGEVPMPLLLRSDIYSKNAGSAKNISVVHTSEDIIKMPSLLSVESASSCSLGLADSYTNDTNRNVSVTSSSPEIVETDSDLEIAKESTSHQTAAATSSDVYDDCRQGGETWTTLSRTDETDSASEKTYAVLQNCEIAYTHTAATEKMQYIQEDEFSYSSILNPNETQKDIFEQVYTLVQTETTDFDSRQQGENKKSVLETARKTRRYLNLKEKVLRVMQNEDDVNLSCS